MLRNSCSSSVLSICRSAVFVMVCHSLAGCVAGQRNSLHGTAIAVVVVDWIVLGAAIVPEGDRANLPTEAAGELRPRLLLAEKIEERRAFRFGHILETQGMRDIDVGCLATRLRMRAHHRMLGEVFLLGILPPHVFDAILAGPARIGLQRAVDGDQSLEQALHAPRQCRIGEVGIGKQGVAAPAPRGRSAASPWAAVANRRYRSARHRRSWSSRARASPPE